MYTVNKNQHLSDQSIISEWQVHPSSKVTGLE